MSRVYLSFLGLGTYNEVKKKSEYRKTVYELNGIQSKETEFVQVAEFEILGVDKFDKIIVVATEASHNAHFKNLQNQLQRIGVGRVIEIIIEEDMSPEGQWGWFEQILNQIEAGDELTVDLTHGYRSIPIIFSTAINFLQKAKNISLRAAYYGAYEKDRKLAPIVDMKDFYIINEWAEAISRLVEDADARKIAALAEKSAEFQVGELSDPALVNVFEDLTNTLRNVDVNNVSSKATNAIQLIEQKEENVSDTGKILLHLVRDKFFLLYEENLKSGRYDAGYFKLQLMIIKMLLDHKLYMQAFTVMRELIGSIGLIEDSKANIVSSKGRTRRRRADIFFNMVQYDKDDWKFDSQAAIECEKMMPFYAKLEINGVCSKLKEFAMDLAMYRNGFDHAWTKIAESPLDIKEKGELFFNKLNETVQRLQNSNILQ